MIQKNTTPYTYFIKWTTLNRWYYGVRYAKGCHPSEFWKKYFTSSKRVKNIFQEHGNPDIIQIRKVFDSPDSAIKWEKTVLTRMNTLKREDSLNMNIAGSVVISPDIYAENVQKRKITNLKNSRCQKKENNPMWSKRWITNGIVSIVVEKDYITPNGWRDGRVLKSSSPSQSNNYTNRKKKISLHGLKNTVWITDGTKNKRVGLEEMLPPGWRRGHTVRDKNTIKGSANTIWITDRVNNKKLHKTALIPEGWVKGRTNSFPGRWDRQ